MFKGNTANPKSKNAGILGLCSKIMNKNVQPEQNSKELVKFNQINKKLQLLKVSKIREKSED